MNLENLKIKKFKITPLDLLRLLMGFVFLTAGFFRIFNNTEAIRELQSLNLPYFFTWPLIILEIGGGLALILKKYLKVVSLIFIVFLVGALLNAIYLDGLNLFNNAGELFVFNVAPTDFFLHFVFLIILISLLIKKPFN